ncbi:E2 domain-associated cysteine-rich protein [Rhizobium laguerreae]|uniref:E2 domain-associated cysteine-rich protein n=1 Tax=Rhizobium laguerreae TaxID=1076926 RepID=UPI0037039D71
MSPLDQLFSVAHDNHGRLLSAAGGQAIYAVNPPNASGAPSPDFILEIRRDGKSVTVAEQRPTLLPPFCAERHINPGGTFCLYWGELEPSEIESREAAEVWWGRLLTFLLRQRSAAALRRWPGKADARAHGSTAARFQAMAEENAAVLGPSFVASLREDHLRLAKGRRRDRIALVKDGRRLVAVHRGERRVMTLRQRCKCDNANNLRLPLAACGDHARQLADLVLNLDGWQRAEGDFYRLLHTQKHVCCGTMDDCPLAKPAAK